MFRGVHSHTELLASPFLGQYHILELLILLYSKEAGECLQFSFHKEYTDTGFESLYN